MIGDDDKQEPLRKKQKARKGKLHPSLNAEGLPTVVKGLDQSGLFSLVWYQCVCSARLRAYNKRQLAPPKYIVCSSCGGRMQRTAEATESRWAHKPHLGQICIKDFTWKEAKEHAELLEMIRMAHGDDPLEEGQLEELAVLIYGDGHRPMTYCYAGPTDEYRPWVERAGPPDGSALDSLVLFSELSGLTGAERSRALRQHDFMDTVLGEFHTSGESYEDIFGPSARAAGERRAAKIRLRTAQLQYELVRNRYSKKHKLRDPDMDAEAQKREDAQFDRELASRDRQEKMLDQAKDLNKKATIVEKDTQKMINDARRAAAVWPPPKRK
jgi:hypothetical protein